MLPIAAWLKRAVFRSLAWKRMQEIRLWLGDKAQKEVQQVISGSRVTLSLLHILTLAIIAHDPTLLHRNSNIQTSKEPLEGQAQGTNSHTNAAIRDFSKDNVRTIYVCQRVRGGWDALYKTTSHHS